MAEFFAGIGLARLGLEQAKRLKVVWANDIAEKKQQMYVHHFGEQNSAHYDRRDIKTLIENPIAEGVPAKLGLAWASFPCTDLSLAGARKGLAGKHSSTFFDFIEIVRKMEDQRPRVIALENVNGFATSHGGADMKAAIVELNLLGYSVDVLTLDARRWVPQSRPRLFIIAVPLEYVPVSETDTLDRTLRPAWLDRVLDDPKLHTHRALLPSPPPLRESGWSELVSRMPTADVEGLWWDVDRMAKFEEELSKTQWERVHQLASLKKVVYRTAYRRTRGGVPKWEIRNDDIAGCLRTTGGGSSKQAVVRIEGKSLQARWMTPREYAALMGAPDYKLGEHENQARMGFGDAVCVDAVAWLAQNYLEPYLAGALLGPAADADEARSQ